MSTTVVNVRGRLKELLEHPCFVYVGRAFQGVKGSRYANRFIIGRDGNREQCITEYRGHLCQKPALIARARRELMGKVLGCWCAPAPCHADVLAEICHPFFAGLHPGHLGGVLLKMSVVDRIERVRSFNAIECLEVLDLDDVQKTVRRAAERRLRQLNRARADSTQRSQRTTRGGGA